jgi:hypothetical protein
VSYGPKKKTSEKSPPASLDFREQKIYWLAFLAIAMILRLVQKRFLGPAKKKKGWDTAGFQETGLAVFFRFHIETLCRLHLIVLVDLIMFTHIKQRICNLTVTCFSPAALFTFTDPMFDVSFSCIMLCHPMRYRYVKCTQARRPSPCRATWRAAHARVADASKRAPLIDASGDDRSQCWSRSK